MTEFNSIIQKANTRMTQGALKYGAFNPSQCKRNLFDEMEDELLDVINYACMQIEKLRQLKEKQ